MSSYFDYSELRFGTLDAWYLSLMDNRMGIDTIIAIASENGYRVTKNHLRKLRKYESGLADTHVTPDTSKIITQEKVLTLVYEGLTSLDLLTVAQIAQALNVPVQEIRAKVHLAYECTQWEYAQAYAHLYR